MRILFFPLAFFLACELIPSNTQAEEKITVVSGGAIRSAGQVAFIRLGAPISGSGLSYRGKFKAKHIHRTASPTVPAEIKPLSINSEFALGEVYVFPNPAKGVQIPVFHVEVGIADSVKITVFNVAGEVVHNYTILGLPSLVNDENELEYAYEYAWRGHIPSGVYYYAMEAHANGKKLRKTGKFAVVR